MAKIITGAFPEKETVKADKPIPGYVLHISLIFSDPLIWRRVQVPGNISLATLHRVIQLSMGWSDSYVHQFLVGKISFAPTLGSGTIKVNERFDERNYELQDLEEGMQFMFAYLYDDGDIWEHEIRLEEVIPSSSDLHNPVLLSGEQACPPETTGDIHAYQALLSSLEDPSSSSHKKLLELTGRSDFDPGFFDLAAAQYRLQLLKEK